MVLIYGDIEIKDISEKLILKLFSIREAAKLIHINRSALELLIDSGQISFIKLGTRKKIIFLELLKYLTRNQITYSKDKPAISDSTIDDFINNKSSNKMNINTNKLLDEIMRGEMNNGLNNKEE